MAFHFRKTAVLMAALLFAGNAFSQTVQIDSGRLNGAVENGVQVYKGIPYAAPPVGELRWRPPQAVQPWQGVRDATRYASQCAQNADLGVFAQAGGSEDCLYLNVFAPADAKPGDNLPVLVWIHGGALFVGAGSDYDGTKLAREGRAVVVTLNYRVALFGFFAHPDIDDEGHAVANYGLMDQNFALDWVQRNIRTFGGNPQNVTISGESSGGQSVIAQMISPWGKGKFQQVIAMSASTLIMGGKEADSTLPIRQQSGLEFAQAVGCETDAANCLRRLSTAEILAKQQPYLSENLIVEGDFLPEQPSAALKNGRFNKVTFINGITRDEGTFFAGLAENGSGKVMTAADYAQAMGENRFKDVGTEKILASLPAGHFSTPSEAYAAAVTSSWFACPAYQVNEWVSAYAPVYMYEFADRTAPAYLAATSFPQGAAHTYELPYLFSGFNGASGKSTALNPWQQTLSDAMIKLWVGASTPEKSGWPRFDAQKETVLSLTLPAPYAVQGQYRQTHHCDFWDAGGLY